jgi:hypothetical protein
MGTNIVELSRIQKEIMSVCCAFVVHLYLDILTIKRQKIIRFILDFPFFSTFLKALVLRLRCF